jgi:hypothetical protein
MKRPGFRSSVLPSRVVWLPLAFAIVIGCEADPTSGRGVRIQISMEEVSGNNQTVAAGGSVSAPLVVRTVDQNGTPRSGMIIEWTLTSGEGTLSAPSSVTNSSGQAQVVYTSGGSAGEASVRAVFAGAPGAGARREIPPVVFGIGVTAASTSLLILPDVRNDS